jgi:Tfp pilus assembly PilM family ATPase
MKIERQTPAELLLTEGSTAGMIVGGAMILGGILAGIFLRAASPYAVYIALALAVIGVVIILFASSITVRATKSSGQLLYEKKRLVGAKSSTYAIGDVFRIETRKQWRLENTTQGNQQMQTPQLVAQSVIVFKNGSELALDHQKTSSTTTVGGVALMGGQGAETAMAAQVAQFLGVPFQEIMPPNMSSGVNIQF